MATFPIDVRFLLAGAGMADTPIVERSDMERGVAKVRRVAADPVVTLNGTLMFRSGDILASFQTWYYSPTGAGAGAAWFDWTDPRTNTVRQARLVAGAMGPVTPLAGRFGVSTQAVALEYVSRL